MSLGVDGQYYLSISLDGNSDFIDKEDLDELTIFEYTGNVLPQFELNFISADESIFSRLNEGNSLDVRIGKTSSEAIEVILYPSTMKTAKDGATRRVYEIKGFCSSISYITNHNIKVSDKKSGIEVAIEVAKENSFETTGSIAKSKDKQNWVQYSISDKKFLNDTIMHSDLGTSFPVFAITADRKFIIKDIQKELKKKAKNPDWRFTKDALSPNDINYDADVIIESKAGFINSWIGYGKTLTEINSETGIVNNITEEPEIIMSLSNKLDKSIDVKDRFGGSRNISDNVHINYWKSYNHNLQGLANLSKIDNTLSFTDAFHRVVPADIVSFREESNSNEQMSGEEQSGTYIVSGVILSCQLSRIVTTVIMNREAFNNVRTK